MELRETKILVETDRHRIIGTLSLPRDGYRSRLTDYLNADERIFLALTDVELERLDGDGESERCEFLALAIGQIVFARPLDGEPAETV
ncbi:MAG TPA: hypothetical protein VG223_11835 [Solirubrobacteraceae bacterium]|jgi:hypothetical protein|nr:hypothetical protein [Solirubrobacteraceae bacterium]